MTISKVKSRTRQQFICLWKAYQMFLFRNCHTVLARFQCHTSQCTFIYSLTHTHIPVHTSTQSYFLQFTCFALLTFILSKCVCMEINIFSQHTYLHSTLSFFFFFVLKLSQSRVLRKTLWHGFKYSNVHMDVYSF